VANRRRVSPATRRVFREGRTLSVYGSALVLPTPKKH
jgi:hypothetical protein